MKKTMMFLLAAAMAACGPTAPSFHDPWYAVYVRPAFDTSYTYVVDDTLVVKARFAVTAHAIADPDNQDAGSVPPDYTFPLRRDQCTQMAGGSNGQNAEGHDVRIRFVFTVVPVRDRGNDLPQPGDTLGPVYQSDTLDTSPAVVPVPAPYGNDPDHLVVWKVRLSDGTSPRPVLLPFAVDTMNAHVGDPCARLFVD